MVNSVAPMQMKIIVRRPAALSRDWRSTPISPPTKTDAPSAISSCLKLRRAFRRLGCSALAHPFDERHRSGVATAGTRLDDTRITTGTPFHGGDYVVEKALDGLGAAQAGRGQTARGQGALACQRDHLLGRTAGLTGLGQGGLDAALDNQVRNQPAHKLLAMGLGPP
jgi:hypothetical protein